MNNNFGWNALFKVRYLILFVSIIYFLQSLLRDAGHDWDLEAFLYMGARLDVGELIYFYDFETKLPFVQYLFWIPYRLGGIGAWRLVNFLIVVISSVVSSYLIVSSIVSDRSDRRQLVFFSSAVSLMFVYSLPGASSAHINIVAAMFLYLGLALCLRGIQSKHETSCSGFSAIAVGLAISIRPNYLFVLPAVTGFAIVAPRLSAGRYGSAVKQTLIFTTGVSLALIVQFLPYLFYANGLSTLFSALVAMQQFPLSTSPAALLDAKFRGDELAIAFYLFLYPSALILIFALQKRGRAVREPRNIMMFGALTCLASVLLLDLSFISTHYWAHYVAMFVPFANIIAIYAYILFRDTNSPSFNDIALRRKGEFTIFIVLISFMILSAAYSLEYALKLPRIGLSNFAINDRSHDRKLLNVLRQAREEGASFYVLRDPVYHRKLDHRRLGDAHPFMLETVLRGDRIGPVGDIFLYGDRVYADPCQSLLSSEKDIIVLASPKLDREAWLCLTRADSNYVDLSELADEDGSVYFQLNKLDNYGIFVRRPR